MKRALVAYVLVLAACAGVSRDAILSRTLAGLQAADKAFVAKDEQLQAEIVATATTEAQGRADLLAYRGRRDKVAAAFVVAYTAVATASVDLTEASLVGLAKAASAAITAFKELAP